MREFMLRLNQEQIDVVLSWYELLQFEGCAEEFDNEVAAEILDQVSSQAKS